MNAMKSKIQNELSKGNYFIFYTITHIHILTKSNQNYNNRNLYDIQI